MTLPNLRKPILEMFGDMCKARQIFADDPAGEYGEVGEGQAGVCKENQKVQSWHFVFVLSRTALMMACEAGSLNMVEAFLRKGVDVFEQNALHYSKLSKDIGFQNLLSSNLSLLELHDQGSQLSSERSGTPKQCKAPPLPISPIQLLNPFFFLSKGVDSLLDVSSEADQQDLLLLMQAKITSLTLHNKELKDKLQVAYFCAVLVLLKMKYLQEDLKDMQRKLENSEAERKHIEAQVQSRVPKTDHLNSTDISGNGSDLNVKFQEIQNRYEEAVKEVLNVQRQMKLSVFSSESEETNSELSRLKVTCKEVEMLKQELKRALEESERQKEKVRALQKKFEEREECEEIKRLQDKLTNWTQLESSAEAGEMKDAMQRMIDELNRKLSELSQLYKEAQTKLEDYRKTKALDDIALDYIPRDEHEKLIQVTNSLKNKAENELSEMKTQYTKVLDEAEVLKQLLDTQKQMPITEHRQVMNGLRNTVKEKEEEINELKGLLTNKESEVRNLQKELLEEKVAINEAMVPKTTYEKLQSSLESEVSVLSTKLKDVIKEKENVSLDAMQLRNEVLHLKEEKEGMHTLLEAKKREVTGLHQKYHQAQDDLEMKRYSESSSKPEEDKDEKINEMSKELSKLKEALNSFSQLSYSTSAPKRQSQQLEALQQVNQLQNQLTVSVKFQIKQVHREHSLFSEIL
uniref:Uncharacterized protein n=1 Tax=Falco tinnunculus TaxID=100819 RepID=A0A8C4V6E6_FALTI